VAGPSAAEFIAALVALPPGTHGGPELLQTSLPGPTPAHHLAARGPRLLVG
jgi:hypothetical protein